MNNVRNRVYTGEEPLIAACFAHINKLVKLGPQMKAILAAGKEVKGTLNEAQYDDRLGEKMNCPDELRRIVSTQEYRRSDYFRTRMLLQHHILPTVKESIAALAESSQAMLAQSAAKPGWAPRYSYDQLSVMGEIQGILEGQDVLEHYQRARDFVAEADATNGQGERSFDRIFKFGESYWNPSAIPEEFLLVEGIDAHPLDRALRAVLAELMPPLAEAVREVDELAWLSNYERGKRPAATLVERARWAELFPRVMHNVPTGSDFDGWHPGFGDREAAAALAAAKALAEALPTFESKQRWLAQNNLLAFSRIVGFGLEHVRCTGFNLTMGASCVLNQMARTTTQGFTDFMSKAEEAFHSL